MPLFSRKPRLKDKELEQLAQMFANFPDAPTPGSNFLDTRKLDFSLESLKHVDDYLEAVRSDTWSDSETATVVMRSGAYVGEVLRRNSTSRTYHWLDYDGAVRADGRLKQLGGKSLGLAAVLWDGEGFVFPFGKTGKFLQNGREDSTYFFAAAIIAEDQMKDG